MQGKRKERTRTRAVSEAIELATPKGTWTLVTGTALARTLTEKSTSSMVR
jgi:hypothetical protein